MNFLRAHWSIVAAGILMFLLAWFIYRPKPAPPEPPRPAVRQKDGSLELERAPQLPGTPAQLKPAGIIPKGGKVEREIRVTIDPNVAPSRAGDGTPQDVARGLPLSRASMDASGRPSNIFDDPKSPAGPRCPQVTVDLSLVRMPDQTRRVIASSPNGAVVGGLDVPIDNPKLPAIPRWTASALVGYDSSAKRDVFGGAVQYKKGPFVFTGGVIGGTVFTGAGISF
jgi:hypothetical protein